MNALSGRVAARCPQTARIQRTIDQRTVREVEVTSSKVQYIMMNLNVHVLIDHIDFFIKT